MSQITIVRGNGQPNVQIKQSQLRQVEDPMEVLNDRHRTLLAHNCPICGDAHGSYYQVVTSAKQVSGYSAQFGRFFSVHHTALQVTVLTGTVREDLTEIYHTDGRVTTKSESATDLVIKGRRLTQTNRNDTSRQMVDAGTKVKKTGTVKTQRRATFKADGQMEDFEEITEELTVSGETTTETRTTRKAAKIPARIIDMFSLLVDLKPEENKPSSLGADLAEALMGAIMGNRNSGRPASPFSRDDAELPEDVIPMNLDDLFGASGPFAGMPMPGRRKPRG